MPPLCLFEFRYLISNTGHRAISKQQEYKVEDKSRQVSELFQRPQRGLGSEVTG